MEGYTLPEFFTFNFFSVDRTLNAFKHNENAKLPEDVRLLNLVRYQAKAGLNEYENTLLAKSRGYDVWISDKEAYDWQQRTLKPCDWIVPTPSKPKKTSTRRPRCYTPDSKARHVISYWRERAERMNADLVRESFEIWLKSERNKKKEKEESRREEYLGEWNLSAQAQPIPPLFTLSDFDIDEQLRCDEEDAVITIAESPLPPEIIEDGGNKWFPLSDDDDDVFQCAQRTPPVPIVIEDISDAETDEGGEKIPIDEGFDEVADDQLARWTTAVEKRERTKRLLVALHRSIEACEKRCKAESWRVSSTKQRLQRLRAGWSTRKRRYDALCTELDETEKGIDEYREQRATVKRLKLSEEESTADVERYDYDPREERKAVYDLCQLLSP